MLGHRYTQKHSTQHIHGTDRHLRDAWYSRLGFVKELKRDDLGSNAKPSVDVSSFKS